MEEKACAQYLVALKTDPDLQPLYDLASAADDEVARRTIVCLGKLKTARDPAVPVIEFRY